MIGDELLVEVGEHHKFDEFAVAVMKSSNVVDHVPREISKMCWFFLQKIHSSITCRITDKRKLSTVCGKGLVVPCIYIFIAKLNI